MKILSRTLYFVLILLIITACSRSISTPSPTETIPVTIPQPTPSETITPTANPPTSTFTLSPQGTAPTTTKPVTPSPTLRPGDSRWWSIEQPYPTNPLSSPIYFMGETNMTPEIPTAYVMLLDDRGLPFAQTLVKIKGYKNYPGSFAGVIFFYGYEGRGYMTIRETPEGTDYGTMAVTFVSEKP